MRTTIVTGASRGIGRAVAVMLAAEGYDFFLAGRDIRALEETAGLLQIEAGKKGLPAPGVVLHSEDLRDPGAADRIFSAFINNYDRIDLLVNNAGVVNPGRIGEYSSKDWDDVFNINARAPFFLMQHAVPMLKKADPGFIINICSIVAKKGYANQALYSASKHALLGATKAVARDLQGTGIRVHAINPGGVDTDLVRSVRPDIDTSEMISPEEIADTVRFLISMKGNAFVDEISLRRSTKLPWD